jgi:ArsR family transcriptional regulator
MERLIQESSRSTAAPQAIYDRLSALADPIRCRLLLLLDRHELTVSELCSVVQLPQSTVSRHLKTLADDGWVAAHRDGTSRRYTATVGEHQPSAQRLWAVVRDEMAHSAAAAQDLGRLREVLAQRRTRSQEFFSSAAGRWAEMRRELFGERFDLFALLGLLDPEWTVGDLGAGTGLLARSLAPFVGRVIAVDESAPMLDAAAARLEGLDNVDLRQGLLEELPIAEGELDAAMLVLVLHHVAEPELVLSEAYRALQPGGRLLLVDMLPHESESYRHEMGHVWLGFGEEDIERRLGAAGFERSRSRALPPDSEARGPGLFAASAWKPNPTT